jgi:hypothetical protein
VVFIQTTQKSLLEENTMKKLLALVLVAVMAFSVLPMSLAADVPAELAEAFVVGDWPLASGTYDPALDGQGIVNGSHVYGLFKADYSTIADPASVTGYTSVASAADVVAGTYYLLIGSSGFNYVILGEPGAAPAPEPSPEPEASPEPEPEATTPDTQPAEVPDAAAPAGAVDLKDQTVTFGTTDLLGTEVQSFTDKDGVVFVKFKDVIALYNKALPLALGYEYKDGVAYFSLGVADPIKSLDPAVDAATGDVTVSTSKFQFPGASKSIPAYAYKIPGESNAQNWIPKDASYYS